MGILADGGKAVVLIPVVRNRVEVELPVITVAVDVGHIPLPNQAVIIM